MREAFGAALQNVRKISGHRVPSTANRAVFDTAVDDVAAVTAHRVAVCGAIAERRLLLFDYNGRTRIAIPCAHGVLTTGNEAMRAHEVVVDAAGRRVAPGKLYLLASMSAVHPADEGFTDPPHGYRRGDSAMPSIHCQL